MRVIALVARRPLTYGGRAVKAGDVFETTPIDAAILTYRRHAAFAPKGVTASSASAIVSVPHGIAVEAPGEDVGPLSALPSSEPIALTVTPPQPRRRKRPNKDEPA